MSVDAHIGAAALARSLRLGPTCLVPDGAIPSTARGGEHSVSFFFHQLLANCPLVGAADGVVPMVVDNL
jgi:hypothetical protein